MSQTRIRVQDFKTSCIFPLLWGILRSREILPPLTPNWVFGLHFMKKKKKKSTQVNSPVAVPDECHWAPCPGAEHPLPSPRSTTTHSFCVQPDQGLGKRPARVFQDGPGFRHSSGGPATHPGCWMLGLEHMRSARAAERWSCRVWKL